MRKLSLNKLKLGTEDLLQKEQLKTVFGGYGSCGYKSPSGEVWCGLSYHTAYSAYQTNGGNWCCDSCGSASYC